MKYKLDENLGEGIKSIFQEKGIDVKTVKDEGLNGISDNQLYDICCKENRCLVTLDLDFSDIIRFLPEETSGIVVIRQPRNSDYEILKNMICQFVNAIQRKSPENQLWIVEENRIRIHLDKEDGKTDSGA